MTRTRLILTSLLPAFWLLGLMTGQAETERFAAGGSMASLSASAGKQSDDSTDLARTLHQSALRYGRRVNLQTGSSGASAPVLNCEPAISRPNDISFVCNGLANGFDLANTWQFYWRTASEPRAPSSVS